MKNDAKIPRVLLRDGHSLPITGLHPEDLKRAVLDGTKNPERPIKHVSALNALVGTLGFKGDFGAYRAEHWPRVQQALASLGARERVNLFAYRPNDITLPVGRRALADRVFLGECRPRRVFLGVGKDWTRWDSLFNDFSLQRLPFDARPATGTEDCRRWLYGHRALLMGSNNFLGDQWLDIPSSTRSSFMRQIYFAGGPDSRFDADRARAEVVLETLRDQLLAEEDGWVDVHFLTESLALLRAADGTWDLIWRNLREGPAPEGGVEGLSPMDTPHALRSATSFAAWVYYRTDVWQEREGHLAEQHHYAHGGQNGAGYPGFDNVLQRYLTDSGLYTEPRPRWTGTLPGGFTEADGPEGRIGVSALVTIEQMQAMMAEAGYADRRIGDQWEPGNVDDAALPATAMWLDAQAYCAWLERELGCEVRLPTMRELRTWFPIAAPDGETGAGPWAVERTEEWEGVVGEPETHRFRDTLAWRHGGSGLLGVDAADVPELSQRPGVVAAKHHNHGIPADSWGAYKGWKTVFRVVIAL